MFLRFLKCQYSTLFFSPDNWEFPQASASKDAPFSVSRVAWSPDGTFVGVCLSLILLLYTFLWMFMTVLCVAGVAFSKHLVHLYATVGTNDLRQHLEVNFSVLSFFFFWQVEPYVVANLKAIILTQSYLHPCDLRWMPMLGVLMT